MDGDSTPQSTPVPAEAPAPDRKPRSAAWRWFGFALRLGGTVGLMALIFSGKGGVDVDHVLAHIRDIDPAWYLLALMLATLAQGLIASNLRWSLNRVITVQTDRPELARVRFATALRAHGLGLFANLFLPTSIGGDVVKSVALRRDTAGVVGAAGAVVLTRAIGVPALVINASLGLMLCWQPMTQAVDASGAILGVSLATVFSAMASGLLVLWVGRKPLSRLGRRICPARLRAKFNPLFDVGEQMTLAAILPPLLVAMTYAFSSAVWCWCLSRGLGMELGVQVFMLATPTVFLATLAPISVQGIGVRETAFAALLACFGVPTDKAVAFALLSFSLAVIYGLLGGLLFAVTRRTDEKSDAPNALGVPDAPDSPQP